MRVCSFSFFLSLSIFLLITFSAECFLAEYGWTCKFWTNKKKREFFKFWLKLVFVSGSSQLFRMSGSWPFILSVICCHAAGLAWINYLIYKLKLIARLIPSSHSNIYSWLSPPFDYHPRVHHWSTHAPPSRAFSRVNFRTKKKLKNNYFKFKKIRACFPFKSNFSNEARLTPCPFKMSAINE